MNLILRKYNGSHLPIALRRGEYNRSLIRLVDGMLEDYFVSPATSQGPALTAPSISFIESDQAFEIEAELPGVTKENIRISIDGKHVSIEAEVKRTSKRKEGEAEAQAERVTKKFARSFTLPVEVDDGSAIAKLENGILTLTLPKKAEPKAKQIAVQ
jgi:HSP20 family protein